MLTDSSQTETIELTPKVKSLMGSFKLPENFDYKKTLEEEINKKHG